MSMYKVGMITGIVITVLLAAVFAKYVNKMRKGPCKYDERQELVRGKGFKYGFLTLMAYDLVMGGLYLDEAPGWCDTMMQNLLGIILAVSVFGVYCIWNDAYMSLNESPSVVYLVFGGIGGMNLLAGTMNWIHGSVVENGRLTFRGANLMLGMIFALFALVFWLRNHVKKEEAD